jgi:hypothetical protein
LIFRLEFTMSDGTWNAVCDSLKTHPRFEFLDLQPIQFGVAPWGEAVLKSRIEALLDMLKKNTSIRRIHGPVSNQYQLLPRDDPTLSRTNRLRPRVRAIQKTRPITYRAKVLGLALLSARTNVKRVWTLLSGNAEVAFPSKQRLLRVQTSLRLALLSRRPLRVIVSLQLLRLRLPLLLLTLPLPLLLRMHLPLLLLRMLLHLLLLRSAKRVLSSTRDRSIQSQCDGCPSPIISLAYLQFRKRLSSTRWPLGRMPSTLKPAAPVTTAAFSSSRLSVI